MLPHALNNLSFVERFYSYAVIGSTNDAARSLAAFPAKGIFVIQADRQRAGRGRSGAPFFSDSSGGLWVSIVASLASLGGHFSHNRALLLAICESVENTAGKKGCCIKWPNDVLWNGRKLCGILLENHPGRENVLIIGFGLNVSIPEAEFPPEIRKTATSLLIETGVKHPLPGLLRNILGLYHENCAAEGEKIHAAYSARLYGAGMRARVGDRKGVIDGVEIDGRLRLKTEEGAICLPSGRLIVEPPS